MRLDSLVKAIEAADFTAFREMVLLSLHRRGYQPSLTDGPHDGGADFLSYVLPPNAALFAVMVSIERNWQKKLRSDASKAQRKLGAKHLLFFSSRVITEPVFREIADDLLRRLDVHVQKFDPKDLGSQASMGGFTNEVLRLVGIDIPTRSPRQFQPPDLRQDVAYACAFFGTDAHTFRKSVVENAVLAAAFHAGGSLERKAIVAQTAQSLGLASNQELQVESAIDRMLQDGRLLSREKRAIALDPNALDNWTTATALQENERGALDARVDALLAPHVKDAQTRRASVAAISADLGALWLQAGRAMSSAFGASAQEPLRVRVRHLDAALDTIGIADPAKREKLLRDLRELAGESPFGRALTAGEVFINLMSMKTPHVFRAFGGETELCVILDTSVAMPLLCSLLYDAAGQDFFVAARHGYEQLLAHGASIALPKDYLEEVASHLLAAVNYREIVDADPDLSGSSNAFVAHYVALRGSDGGKVADYATYLAGFGVGQGRPPGDSDVERDMLMARLRGRFDGYGIKTRNLSASASAAKRAQKALDYAMRERHDLGRAPVLVRHDVTTLAWLPDQASDTKRAYVICTWDKLHPYVQTREQAEWDALDPVALGDVLSLASSGSEDVRLASPVLVALTMSVAAEKLGAAVWDSLVEIEKEKMHDAVLRRTAADFKRNWVEEAAKDKRPRALQDAWESWKTEHLAGPAEHS